LTKRDYFLLIKGKRGTIWHE